MITPKYNIQSKNDNQSMPPKYEIKENDKHPYNQANDNIDIIKHSHSIKIGIAHAIQMISIASQVSD